MVIGYQWVTWSLSLQLSIRLNLYNTFNSLRKHPFLPRSSPLGTFPPRETSPATKSEGETDAFAGYMFKLSRKFDVSIRCIFTEIDHPFIFSCFFLRTSLDETNSNLGRPKLSKQLRSFAALFLWDVTVTALRTWKTTSNLYALKIVVFFFFTNYGEAVSDHCL